MRALVVLAALRSATAPTRVPSPTELVGLDPAAIRAKVSTCGNYFWAYQSDDLAMANTPFEPQALIPSVPTMPSSSLANLTVKMRSIVTVVCNSRAIDTPYMPHKSDDDASAPTASPQQHCATCRRPQWSWETVGHMAFTHTCNVSGPWSEDALDVLQRFPIVNIERYMSQHQQCFARHRSQWAGPSTCWLNVSHGNPACSTWTGPGGPGSNGPPWSWQGAGLAGCSCPVEEAPAGLTPSATDLYVEDHLISACKQLKERNANLATIFYHDSANMWTNDQISSWGRIGRQPRYWNPCVLRADNEIVERHPAWLLRNSSGRFVWDHYANNHIIDHSYPQAQQRWIDVCMNATRSGAVDGCFADFPTVGVGPGLDPTAMAAWSLTADKAASWSAGHQKALVTLDSALRDGILVQNSGNLLERIKLKLPLPSGMMLETFTADQIPIVQAAAKLGIVNQVHCNMYGKKTADVRDALAAFLIATGPFQYFSGPYGWQIVQTCADPLGLGDIQRRWLPEFDRPLGNATGLVHFDSARNVSSRDFLSGTTVTFNHTTNRGTIRWGDGSVTAGPGCAPSAPTCVSCLPPLYEKGSISEGTGGCTSS